MRALMALAVVLVFVPAPAAAESPCFPGRAAVRSADGVVAIRGDRICVATAGGAVTGRVDRDRVGNAAAIHPIAGGFYAVVSTASSPERELRLAGFRLRGGELVPACGMFPGSMYGVTDHGSLAVWSPFDRAGRGIDIRAGRAGLLITARHEDPVPPRATLRIKRSIIATPGPCPGPPVVGDFDAFERVARAIEKPPGTI